MAGETRSNYRRDYQTTREDRIQTQARLAPIVQEPPDALLSNTPKEGDLRKELNRVKNHLVEWVLQELNRLASNLRESQVLDNSDMRLSQCLDQYGRVKRLRGDNTFIEFYIETGPPVLLKVRVSFDDGGVLTGTVATIT